MTIDEKYIRRCFEIANLGKGKAAPNPMVGSVVVYNNKIIGEGWHKQYGGPHAEVNAIENVTQKELLQKSTIYVSLEPCAHFGNTPPCVDLILTHKIPNVVIGTKDPNPKVAGKSIEKLRKAGINVAVGVLEKEAINLDKAFFTSFQKKRPFITLKWAQSKDGYFAPMKGQKWLSNLFTKRLTHKWRNQIDAILVGHKTVLEDNPQLTDRFWNNNQPVRIVLDSKIEISEQSYLIKDGLKTIVFNSQKSTIDKNIEFIKLDTYPFKVDKILNQLHERKITSLLVEGGSKTIQYFLNENLWDEAYIYNSVVELGEGINSPNIPNLIQPIIEKISDNTLEIYYNN